MGKLYAWRCIHGPLAHDTLATQEHDMHYALFGGDKVMEYLTPEMLRIIAKDPSDSAYHRQISSLLNYLADALEINSLSFCEKMSEFTGK